MSKRVRIDFVLREIEDTGTEDQLIGSTSARGISFGDEIDAGDIHDFFNRCRDSANLLVNGKCTDDTKRRLAELQLEVEAMKQHSRQNAAMYGSMTSVPNPGVAASKPVKPRPHIHSSLDEAFDRMMRDDPLLDEPGQLGPLRVKKW